MYMHRTVFFLSRIILNTTSYDLVSETVAKKNLSRLYTTSVCCTHNWSESVFQLLADTYQACENDTQKKMATSVLPSTYIMCNVVCVYVYVSHRCFMGGRASK